MENIVVNFHCNRMSTKMLLYATKQLLAPNCFEKVPSKMVCYQTSLLKTFLVHSYEIFRISVS